MKRRKLHERVLLAVALGIQTVDDLVRCLCAYVDGVREAIRDLCSLGALSVAGKRKVRHSGRPVQTYGLTLKGHCMAKELL
jgi:hypothetical protein